MKESRFKKMIFKKVKTKLKELFILVRTILTDSPTKKLPIFFRNKNKLILNINTKIQQ